MPNGELREGELPQPTPIIDYIEKRSVIVGGLLRVGRRIANRIRQRRADREAAEIHRAILNGEAPSFDRKVSEDDHEDETVHRSKPPKR